MGTRSIIGAVTEAGSIGTYCHYDGYPTGNGRELQTILKRDGYDKVTETLLSEPAGFSFLDVNADEKKHADQFGDMSSRTALIPGYGIAYRDVDNPELIRLMDVLQNREDYFWAEFAYFVRPDGGTDAYRLNYQAPADYWVIEPDNEITSDEPPITANIN